MKLFTISNKWLVEILIQLFSLYENNNKITFELDYEMEKLIKKKMNIGIFLNIQKILFLIGIILK